MSLNIPDFMPVLSRGKHGSPAEGACIMEYASFLNGERWTDLPSCTNEVLARAAQYVNDELDDDERQQLLPLLPRLMGASKNSSEVDWAIAQAAADYVEPLASEDTYLASSFAQSALYEASRKRNARYVTGEAHVAVSASNGDLVDFLSHLIDAYDKAVGRTEAATVTEDDLRRCAELTAATK